MYFTHGSFAANYFKTISPQGDGNIISYCLVSLCVISKPYPRKGTETSLKDLVQ